MQVSKLLTTTVAAVAMAGALTMAYAQTSGSSTGTPATSGSVASPSAPMQSGSTAMPDATTQSPASTSGSSSTMPSGSSSGSTPMASPSGADTTQYSGERPAQADRN